MATIESILDDYFPGNGDISVPLSPDIYVLFDREMDETVLSDSFFVEGPDTDQFVGPDLDLLEYPDNVSQGDDFLTSPGYKGIVQGTITFEKISTTDETVEVESAPYRTKLIFTPTKPLAALTEYKAHIPEATDLDDVAYTGYYTFSWTTGTGSISALPSTASTSVLSVASLNLASVATKPVVAFTLPKNNSVEHPISLSEIVVEFDKEINPASVNSDMIDVVTYMTSDHPDILGEARGELVKTVEVNGKRIVIKI